VKTRRAKSIKAAIIVMACLLITWQSAYAQEAEKAGDPEHHWLNGKWSGPAPLGGELQLELQVVNDNKVTGKSRIPMGGSKRSPSGSIQGTVDGDRVNLEISYPKSTQNWRFLRKDQTLAATRKGEEVVFKKVE